MKKVICFSLWGDNTRYTHGALENIKLAKEVYPEWICRFYVGKNTPKEIIKSIDNNENTEIIVKNNPENWTGMFWRFEACSDPLVDVMISRDCDSRLWYREKKAVDDWLSGEKFFHIMRDHQYHGVPILGGMWGAKKGILNNISDLIEKYDKGNYWQIDQKFLAEKIYPLIKNNCCVHDEFFENKKFPDNNPRNPRHFVGQAYSGDGTILDYPENFQAYREKYEI
mgnify:CR=1 FL=1|tara:strand:+ start:423 stop:1097 length:675 start_codon:yes stop_codon:yes gene_type:complete